MNILLVTSFFLPSHPAGTEKLTFAYARALLERGHTVRVLCAEDWDTGEQYWNGTSDEIYQDIPVRRIHLNWQKSPDPNAYLYINPLIQQHLREWLREWKPDLVHITSCITLSASVIPAAKEAGLPVILTLTDFWFLCHKLSLMKYDHTICDGITTSQDCTQCLMWDTGVYRKLRKAFSDSATIQILNHISKISALSRQRGFRGMALNISQRKAHLASMIKAADIVIAPTHNLRNVMQHSGIVENLQVIQYGHDLSWLDQYSQKTPSPLVRFGFIGQMIPTKGVHILLEAFGAKNRKGQSELHLYGNPQTELAYYQQLQAVKIKDPESVVYHGSFPYEKLGEILAGIDILVIPSVWHENNPLILQEAFASKTPVIASDVGGMAEYIQHGVNGYLFKRGDSIALGAQMDQITAAPAQIEQLRAHLPAVRSMHAEMDEYEILYRKFQCQSEAVK